MSVTTTIHRAYNDVVASHYDLDPQGVIGRSLDLAVRQLQSEDFFGPAWPSSAISRYRHGDRAISWRSSWTCPGDQIVPFGLDLAENMVENAREPAPQPDRGWWATTVRSMYYFPGQQFDCICTHFVTGYVSDAGVLAPKIANRLRPGGYWSLVGGTKAAYAAPPGQGRFAAPSLADRHRLAKNG